VNTQDRSHHAHGVSEHVHEALDEIKPHLRGWLHAATAPLALAAGIVLVALSPTAATRFGSAVFAASALALFTASATMHRGRWSPRTNLWLRRLDHSSIFLLIAGSYTPVCLVALSGWWGATLLIAVWATAVVGVVLKLLRFERSHRLGFALYLTMGWAVLAAFPGLLSSVDPSTLVLLGAGGVLYTVGAIVLATRFPNPFPRIFGYHEVWHLMVVAAASLHYVAMRGVLAA
jgi:hemolysin III